MAASARGEMVRAVEVCDRLEVKLDISAIPPMATSARGEMVSARGEMVSARGEMVGARGGCGPDLN